MATSRDTGSTAGSLTSDVGRIVRDTAQTQISNQKQRATATLGDIVGAIRQTTQQLNDGGHTAVAQYVNRAADQIDRLSEGLRNRELDDLTRDVRRFAREQPALFLGAAFGLGVLAARFLKSSNDGSGEPEQRGRIQEQRWSGAMPAGAISSSSAPPAYVAHDTDVGGTPRLRDVDDLDIDVDRGQ